MRDLRYVIIIAVVFVAVVAALRLMLGVDPDVVKAYAALVGGFVVVVKMILIRRR